MRKFLIIFWLCLLSLPVFAGEMADKVVGWWVSSSGTPVTLAYSGDDQKLLLRIREGADIEVWLNSSRNGEVVLTYKTDDGATMTGVHNPSNDSINFTSNRGFKATWRRRR